MKEQNPKFLHSLFAFLTDGIQEKKSSTEKKNLVLVLFI